MRTPSAVRMSKCDATVQLAIDQASCRQHRHALSTDFLNRGGGRITAVSIRGEQMLGQPAFFDNLRVGPSFEAVIPEPATSLLLALGLVTLGVARRSR
jgi:hypothetical protein